MRHKNIISGSLKESLSQIWKNKSLFSLLFVLQVIFFSILFFVSFTYTTKIIENAKAISGYMASLSLDDISIADDILQQKNILGEDPLLISRNFNEMARNFRIYLVLIFILLVVFISIAWALTDRLAHKFDFQKSIRIFKKNIIVLLFYLGLIFLFFYSVFNASLIDAAEQGILFANFLPFLILLIALAYLMFVSLSLLNVTELKNIAQKTLIVGIKKAHCILVIYFINIFLLALPMFLIIYFVEKNMFILLLSMILFISSFVFGRIFMVNVVEKLVD